MAWIAKNNQYAHSIPTSPCEEFYDELRFAKNEVRIRRKSDDLRLSEAIYLLASGYVNKMSKEHEKRVKKAKKGNETLECQICYQDELLLDDMLECNVGHLYCR